MTAAQQQAFAQLPSMRRVAGDVDGAPDALLVRLTDDRLFLLSATGYLRRHPSTPRRRTRA